MTGRIFSGLRIFGAALLLALNSILHITPLLLVALGKALLPLKRWRALCDHVLMAIAASWIDVNSWMIDHLSRLRIEVEGLPEAMPRGHFMVLSNHQSWVDIPILQKLFNRRLPFLRFFLKSQLIWVPALGLAWWALDLPFMLRYTREQIARRPELAGRDIEATRKACEKFRHIPVSIVNFVEGTRFSAAKQAAQAAPYRHLLKPRAGGTAFVLEAMGETLDQLIDVTLVYPQGRGELLDLFADRIPEVRVRIRVLPVPEPFRGRNYQTDAAFRAEFQTWLNAFWQAKDEAIEQMLSPSR